MSRPLTDEDLVERAAIDGRVAFAIGTFVGSAALVALLDRVGAPEALVRLLGPLAVLAALATVGVLARSMRVSRFYAAGRAVPTPYLGFAGLAIFAGLAFPFVPPARDGNVSVPVAGGAAAGFVIALLLLGPYLRRTGAFSVGDLVAVRFPNLALRLGLAVTVAVIGALIGLAGFALATGPMTEVLGLPRAVVAAVLAFVLVLMAAPGGLTGIVWAANGAAGTLLAAVMLPIGVLYFTGAMPTPLVGSSPVWKEAARQLAAWQDGASPVAGGLAACGAACGIAALAPLLAMSAAARDAQAAVRGGVLTLLWAALGTAAIATALLWGAVVFSRVVVGEAPDRLPAAIYRASDAGLVELCGGHPSSPAAARAACADRAAAGATLAPRDAVPRAPLFLAGLTSSSGAGAAGLGLLAAALLAVGLTLAASGFAVCAAALGHDLIYRVRDAGAQTSRRLATTRALLVGVVALGAAVTGARDLDARLLVALAATLAATTILPILLLSLTPRAGGRDAVAALLVGLAGAETVLFAHEPALEVLARAAFVGAGAGTLAGLLTSLVGRGEQPEGRAFVEAMLHRDGDVLAPDKGA